MTVFHGGQVRFKDEKGALTDYDPGLVEIEAGETTEAKASLDGYKYRNKIGDEKQYLPKKLSEKTPILLEKNGRQITLTPTDELVRDLGISKTNVKPEKETVTDPYQKESEKTVEAVYAKSTAKDSGVASFTYTSEEHGVKETLTLHEKPEKNQFTYRLETGALIAKKNVTTEGITIYDEKSEDIVAFLTPPWMNDASGNAYSEKITYELQEEANGESDSHSYRLIMTVDEDYLSDKNRKYPVTIDPSLTWSGDSKFKDVYVLSGTSYGKMNFYESGTVVMPAGKNSQGTFETYMQFVGLGSGLSGKTITAATLNAYENSGGAKDQKLTLYKAAKSWSVTGLTYNNRPGSTGSALGTVTSTKTTGKLHSFNVLPYVQGVASGSTDYGLVLKNTTSTPSYASFYGSRCSTASKRPNLTITYTEISSEATNVSVSPAYVKSSTQAAVSWQGLNASDIARVEYKLVKYDDKTQTEGAVAQDFSSEKPITPGSKLPQVKDGCYKVYIRGVNTSGTAGNAVSAGIVHVDSKIPTAEKFTIKDSSGQSIAGKATAEGNPLIEFTGITDDHITTPFLTYAVTAKGTPPESGDYESPAELSINSGKPYSGSFRLSSAYRSLPTGSYTIHVRSVDQAGNEFVKKFDYIKDLDDPTGSITINDVTTGNEITELTGPAKICIHADGTGSDIAESSLKLYKLTGSGSSASIVDGWQQTLAKNFTENKNIILDTLNICDKSGNYRLVLTIKDSAGRSKEITKDITVAYRLPAPDITLKHSRGGTADLSWSFHHDLQQNIKLGYIQGKFGESGQWQTIVPAGANGTLAFEGESQITVPDTEGSQDLFIRGISKDGTEGTQTKVTCTVDKTAPVADLGGIRQGYLQGVALDENLDHWEVYVKKKNAESYPQEPIKTGIYEAGYAGDTGYFSDLMCYLDLRKEPFEPGQLYLIKLIVKDKAGNSAEKTMEFAVPVESLLPRVIPAQLEIDKSEYYLREHGFVIGPEQTRMKLKGNVTGAIWYLANYKRDPDLKDENGNPIYEDYWWNDVLALVKEADGTRKYTVDRVENGLKQDISFNDNEINGNTAETNFYFYADAVSFRLSAPKEAATYYVRAYGVTGEEDYAAVEPGKVYYVADLSETSVHANTFDVKAVAKSGYNVGDLEIALYADSIVNDEFMYSKVEQYAPTVLTVEDKINYKTYLKWNIPASIPEDITYEVYRGTEKDFFPDEEHRIAQDLKTGYFTEINVDFSRDYYYKVCAVKKGVDSSGAFNEARSSFSDEVNSRSVDQNEFIKRLGTKDYWEFTEFNTPNGNGFIEKSKGNFLYQQKDAEIPNEGFDVTMTRAYNSQASSRSVFGMGWSHDYDIELLNICENNSQEFNHVVLKDGNGTIFHFTRESGQSKFVSSLGSYVNLICETEEKSKTVHVSGGGENNAVTVKYKFVLTTKDGLSYLFNSGGQLVLMEEGNGKFVLFEHDVRKGLLSRMVTNNNLAITFTYNDGSNGSDPLTVKEITMPDGSKVQYEYTKPLLASDRLLTKVTEVAGDETIEYEYEYDKPMFSKQPKNLTKIKEAENKNTYTIKYDYDRDQVTEAIYPDGEKFTFDYAEDNTRTITKKYSGHQAVLGEKDFFDRVSGSCEKSIRGVTDMDKLESDSEDGLDVTTYEYRNDLMTSSKTTAEYYEIGSDGYINEKKGVKENKINYNGDNPVSEKEDDGTFSEYTYYTEADGEKLEDLVKTEKETNADGKVTTYKKYSYDSVGNVTETIDYVAGTKVENTYYTEGAFQGELKTMKESLLTVIDPDQITGESLKSTSVYTYEYLTENGVTTKKEACTQTIPKPDGGNEVISTDTRYDVMGREISKTDSRGYKTTSTYDGFGRNTANTYKYSDSNTLKQNTAKTYDKNGMVIYEKLEDGIEKWYTYDNMGRVTATRVKKGSDMDETIHTSYRYQDIQVYQGKGSVTVPVKNAYITREEYPDGSIISETYEDNCGHVVRSYQNGLYTDMTYNSQDDMITKWSMGQTLSAEDGLLELFVYDDKGNVTATVTDPDYVSGTQNTGYHIREDAEAEDGTVTQGSIVTRSGYDADGNATSQTDALGNTTSYAFDKSGNMVSVTLPTGTKYEYQYDVAEGNHTTADVVLEPRQLMQNGELQNATSKSIVVKDATDKTIRIEDLGTSEDDSTSICTTYEYDVRDNLTKATEKEGNYKIYSYDVRDRVTSIDYYQPQGGTAAKTLRTEFTYDDADNLTSMTDKKVSGEAENIYRYTAYEYDGFNRLTGVSECDTSEVPSAETIAANKVSYTYNSKDKLTAIDYPDCALGVKGLRFEYNIHGWLTGIKAVNKSGFEKDLRDYTYTDDGKVGEITDYTDFLSGKSKWMKRTYSYDKLNRPTGIEYTDNMSGSTSTIKEAHYYEYDKNSQITRETTINRYGQGNGAVYKEVHNYTYNSLGQLTESWLNKLNDDYNSVGINSYWYQYDTAGNRIREYKEMGRHDSYTTDYTYNEFNQLVSSNEDRSLEGNTSHKTYSYDNNGNQISETDSITGKQTSYSYDADNRLASATGKTGETVDYTQQNQYNGFGQRVKKQEGSDTTEYFYDGTAVLYTKDKNDAVSSFNLIGAEDNILSTARPGEGDAVEFYTYTKDLRESTINVVGRDGTSQKTYSYTDYGETTEQGENNFYNEICYGGGVYDKTTGLYYLNARYYSPENGSFLTQDSYRGSRSKTETLNLYGYCAGNPISYTDPSGHWIWGVVGAAMGAYDGYKYAKKKGYKGWKMYASIAGGAALGAVNPFKIFKMAKSGYKAYKAVKYTKKARNVYKKTKRVVKVKAKPKATVVAKKQVKSKAKVSKAKKNTRVVKKQTKSVSKRAACFTAGTKIHTKDGFKAIETIKAGDYVWSENPETHEKALKKVKKIFVREKDSVVRLSINGEAIETTNEHPFYVEGHGWTNASDLKVGDKVRQEDGTAGIVEKTKHAALDTPVTVYNFEVEDFHTYYVSEQKVLVHNTCAATAKNTQVAKSSNKASSIGHSKNKQNNSAHAIVPYYPANNGAVKGTEKMKHLMPGDIVDRFGQENGKYLAPINTAAEKRALPYDTDLSDYHQYEVLKPFQVEESVIAPAFGQPGGGIQYRSNVSIQKLLKRGIIKEIGR